ncbi:MAG: HAD family hydrolase [Anaerolineaceae bacterium]|nr:HAD family hydrolase [Anaerolineaceae bacterium]
MIRTVIFDVDDTIYSFHNANEFAVDEMVKYTKNNFGWEKQEFLTRQKEAMADIKRYAGTSGGYRTRLLRYQNMLEAADLPIFPHASALSEIYERTLLDHMIPEEGIEDWMQYLRDKKIRIGIGSDATVIQQFAKLKKLGLLKYIDFMVTSEEAGVEKPARRFFDRCNEKSRCKSEEVMFIGDNPEKDYKGAANAGYQAVWYNPSGKTAEFPMRELRNFREAPALLSEIDRCSETGEG